MGRPKKISDAEAEVIKDAIIDALENNDEVATEEVATEEVATEEVATEEVPTVEPASPGHHSRDFSA
jgi:S-adenosylmethionine synthetase